MPRKQKYKPIFYIAHTFSERHFVRDELVPALHRLGINTLNPFYEPDGSWKEDRPEIRIADAGKMVMPYKQKDSTHRKWVKTVKARSLDIVETDMDLIQQADGIIAFMPDGSTGTTCEIWTCGGIFRWLKKMGYSLPEFEDKPVFLVTQSARLLMHPWIKYATRKVFRDEKRLLRYLRRVMPRLRVELRDRRKRLATPTDS